MKASLCTDPGTILTPSLQSRILQRPASGGLILTVLLLMMSRPTFADLPQPIVSDPRTVAEHLIVDGHIVEFLPLTLSEARMLPRNLVIASIDGQRAHIYAFGKPLATKSLVTGGVSLAFDPNQGTGNYPEVISLSVVGNNTGNLQLTGTAAAPILDLSSSITLTGTTTALTLSSTGSPTISSAGATTGLTFFTSGSPTGDAYLMSVSANPTGNILNVEAHGGTSVFKVDSSGNIVAAGNSVYDDHVVNNASCGTATSGQSTGSTCAGDSGFVVASGSVATINFGTAYGSVNDMQCLAWVASSGDTPTTFQAATFTAAHISISSPVNTTVYAWRCWGVSGG